jgi:hypothetical protein
MVGPRGSKGAEVLESHQLSALSCQIGSAFALPFLLWLVCFLQGCGQMGV